MNKMVEMNVKKLVLTMSLPIIISMLIQALYNVVDSIFLSLISEKALSAVTFCFPVQTMIIAVACGTGVGINSLIARYLGQKNLNFAKIIANHGLFLSVINGLVFGVFGLFASNWFLSLFVSDSEIIMMGNQYLVICTTLSISVFVQITYERIMQATGNAFYNMVIQGLGALLNIILDPIFIFVFKMGVSGAAIATVMGQFFAMFLGIIITKWKINELDISFKGFKIDFSVIKDIYLIAIPAILIYSITSFMTIFMNFILVGFGTVVVTVFGIYFKLSQFLLMAVNGINNAIIPIISFNYGAKQYQRIMEVVYFSLKLTFWIMLMGMLIVWFFPEQLLLLFNADKLMLDIGVSAFRLISLCLIPAGLNIIFCAIMQAVDKSFLSLLITLSRQLLILIPLLYIFMSFWGLNIGWLGFLVTELGCFLFCVLGYQKIIKSFR